MININTLNKLEKLDIGADIDKLENIAALVDYSTIMGNCIVSEKEKETILDLLKQLKPNSNIFKYTWDMEREKVEEFDELLVKNGIYRGKEINDITGNKLTDLIYSTTDNSDLFAFALPDGIDIRIVYVNGILCQATTYNRDEKGKDITQYIKSLIPYNTSSVQNKGILEVRARLTITDESMKIIELEEKNKLRYIAEYLTQEYFSNITKHFTVIAYKFYSNQESLSFDTMWEEYEKFGDSDFKIAEHALIREINKDTLIDAVRQFEDYFLSNENREYTYTSISVCMNNKTTDIYNNKITINEKIKEHKIYKTSVLDIKFIQNDFYIVPRVDIKPVITDDNKSISYIELDSIANLEDYEAYKNREIRFYIDYIGNINIVKE